MWNISIKLVRIFTKMRNLLILLVVAFACAQAQDIDPLVTGGANAILGEFPSAVSFLIKLN